MAKVQTSLRVEANTLNEAKKILAELGLNFSEAVNIFASMVVQEKGLPFEVKITNYPEITKEEATKKVKDSLKNITKNSGKDADDFFVELLNR